jgi:hypothetical protein
MLMKLRIRGVHHAGFVGWLEKAELGCGFETPQDVYREQIALRMDQNLEDNLVQRRPTLLRKATVFRSETRKEQQQLQHPTAVTINNKGNYNAIRPSAENNGMGVLLVGNDLLLPFIHTFPVRTEEFATSLEGEGCLMLDIIHPVTYHYLRYRIQQ